MIEIICIVAVLAVVAFWALRGGDSFTTPQTSKASDRVIRSYEAVPSLFVNAAELALFNALSCRLPRGYILLTKVRMEDIVRVKRAIKDPKMIWHLRGRVKSRHVDFLITDSRGVPLLVIELDGSSHHNGAARNADDLKDGIFKHVNLKLLRITTSQDFDVAARQAIRSLSCLKTAI